MTGYHVGGTVNIDTGGGGDRLESRVITAIDATTVTFTPGLSSQHAAGAKVTGSGNNIAASDPSAGAAVTPRLIGRVEIRYTDGTTGVIVTDRSWRTAFGPLVTDAWYSGADHDARREQPGWNKPGSDLSPTARRRDGSTMDWTSAGIAPPPNLPTALVARAAEPVRAQEELTPVSVTNPAPGTWVFDLGQNITGWPRLNVRRVPAGTTVRMAPAESLNPDGTVNQASLMGGGGSRGVDLFNTPTPPTVPRRASPGTRVSTTSACSGSRSPASPMDTCRPATWSREFGSRPALRRRGSSTARTHASTAFTRWLGIPSPAT